MAIICGTDLSARSRPAMTAAAAIAGVAREPLWVVHVVGEPLALLDPSVRDLVLAAARERLDRELAPAFGGVAVRHAVLEGSPHAALLELARAERARLVVVSSQGHGASPLYRLGGTSERIALDSDRPVLVVRDAAPFEAWSRGERPLRVLVGVDFASSASAAIAWAKELATKGPCHLVFAHLYYEAEALARYGLFDATPPRPAIELERLLERDLANLVGELPSPGSHELRVRPALGRIADPLLALAEHERADLVAVGTHHRRGPARLWSVSGAVLHHASMAVATIPAPPVELAPEPVRHVQRVLVASDLSPASRSAVALAYGILGHGGEVHLLHVCPGRAPAGAREEEDADLAARLEALVPRDASPEIARKVEIAHGHKVRTICEVAERIGADLVCVGSRLGGFRSTVSGLLRQSRKPVLVARPPPA
jgi:nucleotide-binding universal stress UspA family protein